MFLKYRLTVPHLPYRGTTFSLRKGGVAHLPYGGTEAGARVPPIDLNRFSCFLKRGGGGRDKPGAPTCQGRVRTEVGHGTEARAKVQLIA